MFGVFLCESHNLPQIVTVAPYFHPRFMTRSENKKAFGELFSLSETDKKVYFTKVSFV